MQRKFDKTRALSWSAISSFEYNKEQWYKSYILGERQSSPELAFGSYVDKRYQTDLSFISDVPRYPLMQHKMTTTFAGIPLVGLPDGLCFDSFLLADLKTGAVPWTQKRADETGQLTMYLLLIYLTQKIKPEKFRCFIHWIPTKKIESGDFDDKIIFRDDPCVAEHFETKRTMRDLIDFCSRIKKTVKAMEFYAKNHA